VAVTVRLEPMTQEQYDEYRPVAEQDYATSIATSGAMADADAVQRAADDFARLLPDGLQSEGHLFFTAYDGQSGGPVGMLWVHLEEKSDGLHAFGYDFEVREDLRRQGYGRAVMVAAEQELARRGVVSVGLNVFGFNRGAQTLYEQMGFQVTNVLMRKRLDTPAG